MPHTQGEWKFVGECEPLGVPDGRAPFQVWQGKRVIAEIASTEEPSIGVSEGIANARLIAAAPELLAALEYIAQFNPVAIATNPGAIRKRAQTAIAKATKP